MPTDYSPSHPGVLAHQMMPIQQSASLEALLQSTPTSFDLSERVRQYGSNYQSRSAFIDSAGSLATGMFLAAGIVIPAFTGVYGLAVSQDIPQYLTAYGVVGLLGVALSWRVKELTGNLLNKLYDDYRTKVLYDVKSSSPEHLKAAEKILPLRHSNPLLR